MCHFRVPEPVNSVEQHNTTPLLVPVKTDHKPATQTNKSPMSVGARATPMTVNLCCNSAVSNHVHLGLVQIENPQKVSQEFEDNITAMWHLYFG